MIGSLVFLEDCLTPPLAATFTSGTWLGLADFTVDSSWRRSMTVKSQLREI